MSRADEDRVLHGLYFYRESIEEDIQVSGDEILWLAMHPLRLGDAWHSQGELQALDATEFPVEIRAKLLTAKLELPLRYLQYRRLIKFTKRSDGLFVVSVTFAGADRAIKLHTFRGRADLWYREHKEGALGLAITALVSLVTAFTTVLVLGLFLRR
jgi:hypothetical protein